MDSYFKVVLTNEPIMFLENVSLKVWHITNTCYMIKGMYDLIHACFITHSSTIN